MALSNVDEVIALIKAAPTPAEAKEELMARFWRSKLVEEMLARGEGQRRPVPKGWRPNSVCRRRATGCPTRRRSGSWNCGCSA